MMKMSHRSGLDFAVLFLGLLSAFLLAGSAHASRQDPVRIACVGDSITEGNANPEHLVNSWPRILGRLLESEFPGRYDCRNFGRSGATMLRQGSLPYWDQDVFGQGCEFQPEIVLINLGTNDATGRNWPAHGGEFEEDYRDLIAVYQGLESAPQIWLSTLTPIHEHLGSFEECSLYRPHVEETIQRLVAELDLGMIDFESPLLGRPELFPDGLHPSTAGNELMAMAAFQAITGQAPGRDNTIRPRPVSGDSRGLVSDGQALSVRLGSWIQEKDWVAGTGAKELLLSKVGLGEGDFHMRARIRMVGQQDSAAGFVIGDDFFGFEGASGTLFRNGPRMGGGLRLLHPAPMLWERDTWIDFEVVRNHGQVWFMVNGFVAEMAQMPGRIERLAFDPTRSRMQVSQWSVVGETFEIRPEHMQRRTASTPWVDLSSRLDLRMAWSYQRPGGVPGGEYLYSPGQERLLHLMGAKDGASRAQARLSHDQGVSWSEPFELPASLTGAKMAGAYLPDGRVMVVFQDLFDGSPTFGDVVAWIGTYEDLASPA